MVRKFNEQNCPKDDRDWGQEDSVQGRKAID
jgi:hypothetical protein